MTTHNKPLTQHSHTISTILLISPKKENISWHYSSVYKYKEYINTKNTHTKKGNRTRICQCLLTECLICCALFEYPWTQTMEDLEEAFSTLESLNSLFKAVFSCSSTYPLSLNLAFIISTSCYKDFGVLQIIMICGFSK